MEEMHTYTCDSEVLTLRCSVSEIRSMSGVVSKVRPETQHKLRKFQGCSTTPLTDRVTCVLRVLVGTMG